MNTMTRRNRPSALLLGTAFSVLAYAAAFAESTTPTTEQPAQTPTTAPTETAGTPGANGGTQDQSRKDDDVVVCKKMDPPTGSRMGAKKVCHTAAEWRAISDTARDVTNEIQRTGGAENPPGS
jgi:hypothetical protein